MSEHLTCLPPFLEFMDLCSNTAALSEKMTKSNKIKVEKV